MTRILRRLRCLLGWHITYGLYCDRGEDARDGRGQYERRLTCVRCGREVGR